MAEVRNKKNKKTKTEKIEKKSTEKKGLWTRFRIFCNGVKSEFNKVHWPKKEDMIKYSIATVFFIIFCGVFFYIIDIIFAFIRSLF
jgi:preprotein translocase SecE subunit